MGKWMQGPSLQCIVNTKVPFTFEFECNWSNGKLATICHQIIIQQFGRFLQIDWMVIRCQTVAKLPFGWLTQTHGKGNMRYFKFTLCIHHSSLFPLISLLQRLKIIERKLPVASRNSLWLNLFYIGIGRWTWCGEIFSFCDLVLIPTELFLRDQV